MKTIILFLILLIIPVSYSQNKMKMHKVRMNKLEQLERLKLIDVLDLDEETTLRFFVRQKELRNRMEEYKKEGVKLLTKMKYLINNDDKKDELKSTTDYYLALGEKIANKKTGFVKSLNDIFTEEQIAKLLIFEMKFREDIRGMLFKMRKKKRGMFP
ncbi:MAG: hypothetical protein IIA48_04760 [Bacteroidetes bacterium]|nr:hypothetical protein [Bacteroidota bacterium]MCH8941736.1 hypothetical protein [Bacteroidota bacterium]